jgi:Fe-Mn family superoxide dismutase
MFTLPNLPYAYNALEPHLDARTMEIHHSKHHQAYINNLNAAVENTPMAGKSLMDLMTHHTDIPAVRNNGGGHYNHSLFWTVLAPNGGGAPTGAVAEASTLLLAPTTPSRRPFPRPRPLALAPAGRGSA